MNQHELLLRPVDYCDPKKRRLNLGIAAFVLVMFPALAVWSKQKSIDGELHFYFWLMLLMSLRVVHDSLAVLLPQLTVDANGITLFRPSYLFNRKVVLPWAEIVSQEWQMSSISRSKVLYHPPSSNDNYDVHVHITLRNGMQAILGLSDWIDPSDTGVTLSKNRILKKHQKIFFRRRHIRDSTAHSVNIIENSLQHFPLVQALKHHGHYPAAPMQLARTPFTKRDYTIKQATLLACLALVLVYAFFESLFFSYSFIGYWHLPIVIGLSIAAALWVMWTIRAQLTDSVQQFPYFTMLFLAAYFCLHFLSLRINALPVVSEVSEHAYEVQEHRLIPLSVGAPSDIFTHKSCLIKAAKGERVAFDTVSGNLGFQLHIRNDYYYVSKKRLCP